MTTRAEPTPGEWAAIETVVKADDEDIGLAFVDTNGAEGMPISHGEGLANARLMAASKDLLAALEWAEQWMTSNGHVMAGTLEMRAVIAKARGEV